MDRRSTIRKNKNWNVDPDPKIAILPNTAYNPLLKKCITPTIKLVSNGYSSPPQTAQTAQEVKKVSIITSRGRHVLNCVAHKLTKHGLNDDFYELQLWLKRKGISSQENSARGTENRVEISFIFMPSTRCRTWIAFYFQLRNTFCLPTKPLKRILNCYTLNLLFDKLLSSQWWCFLSPIHLSYCDFTVTVLNMES